MLSRFTNWLNKVNDVEKRKRDAIIFEVTGLRVGTIKIYRIEKKASLTAYFHGGGHITYNLFPGLVAL